MVYVGIASPNWANAESTQIGGNRAENKIAFVHFALLTAIRCWDDAMTLEEEHKRAEDEAVIAKAGAPEAPQAPQAPQAARGVQKMQSTGQSSNHFSGASLRSLQLPVSSLT